MSTYSIINADVLDWAANYDGPPFHALLCDAPYEMGFMNKDFDKTGVSFQPETWAALARHLLPGAFLFVFAGTLNDDLISVAMRKAGLRRHHKIDWLTGSGFPKATRIDTQIDKAAGKFKDRKIVGRRYPPPDSDFWRKGFDLADIEKHQDEPTGTYSGKCGLGAPIVEPATDLARVWQHHRYGGQCLKPSCETILVFQVPYSGKSVASIVSTGAGALNIDGGRIGLNGMEKHQTPAKSGLGRHGIYGESTVEKIEGKDLVRYTSNGRWPANFALCHHEGCRRVGVRRVKGINGGQKSSTSIGGDGIYQGGKPLDDIHHYVDPDGLETVESWACVCGCQACGATWTVEPKMARVGSGEARESFHQPSENLCMSGPNCGHTSLASYGKETVALHRRGPCPECGSVETRWLCPVAALGEQSGNRDAHAVQTREPCKGGIFGGGMNTDANRYYDQGSASRFFFTASWEHEIAERIAAAEAIRYCPKASRSERERGLEENGVSARNTHPT